MEPGQLPRLRIGVDVGGTNTDAVVLDPTQSALPGRGVLASHKTPTTPDTGVGIEAAVGAVLRQSSVDASQISSVTIGTTAFLNAVVERDTRRLSRVAVLRLSRSFLRDVPPFSDWPVDLANAVQSYVGYADGGLHIDGTEEAPVVEAQIVEQCRAIHAQGLRSVVVAGVYSPIDREFHQEDTVRTIVEREIPGADVVCSHDVANIGFLERENAAILNAAILCFARRTIRSFQAALKRLGLADRPLYLTQNDGTLLDVVSAARVPIRTFSSGVTNSMRGAAYLSGRLSDKTKGEAAIVVDIGGTTTDVGMMLASGLPRQASAYVYVAGVKVNYSLPHLHSIGLGGGSIVALGSKSSQVAVGPVSVGNKLEQSLVFGGSTTTATDVAVAAGLAKVGSSKAVEDLEGSLVRDVLHRIQEMLEQAIDTVKTSPGSMPIFLVGGGSLLAPDTIEGASIIIRPPFHDVANAVGAACSMVGGTIDMIQNTSQNSMAEVTEVAKAMAIEEAVSRGALRESIYVAKVDIMPIPYLDHQVRSVVTAIGDLNIEAQPSSTLTDGDVTSSEADAEVDELKQILELIKERPIINHEMYRPSVSVNGKTGLREWCLSVTDLEYIADGCYLLGCGGGGNPEPGKLQLRAMLDAGHTVRVVDATALPPHAVIYWGGRMGSPAAIAERLQAHETVLAIRTLMEHMGHESFDAAMGLEIGGSNGLEPLLWGSSRFFDRPVVDGDFMGRANPMCWQTTLTVHRPGDFVPCAIDSGTGLSLLLTKAPRDEAVDRPLRGAVAEMGSLVGLAARPTTAGVARQSAVLRSVSLAWRIGRAMARATAQRRVSTTAEAIVEEVGGAGSATVLFRGKIAAIERTLRKGLSVGVLYVVQGNEAESDDDGQTAHCNAVATGGSLRIPFINENILAEHVAEDGTKRVLATVPDLIALIDRDTGRAVGVPEYRYGCHVVVLGLACSPRWTETARGIEVGGPKGYGYDLEYAPLGKYVEPRSVIQEFSR